MASKKSSNNACCYYVSWENTSLTGTIFLIENLIFLVIWGFDIQITYLLSNILIIYIVVFTLLRYTVNPSLATCTDCANCSSCYQKSFEAIYEYANAGADWARRSCIGGRGLFSIVTLLFLQKVSISVFGVAWLLTLWIFAQSACKKFLGIELCAYCHAITESNPVKDKFLEIYSLIPRASSIRKSE